MRRLSRGSNAAAAMTEPAEDYFRYIPVRPRDVQWGLYVTGAGCTTIAPHSPYPPARHPELYDFTWQRGRTLPEFQVVYITTGVGEFESAPTGPRMIGPGTVFLLFPGIWHRYRPLAETGWREYWVSFGGPSMENLRAQGFFTPERAVLPTGASDAILDPFLAILQRLRSQSHGFPHRIAADTTQLLAALLAGAPAESAEMVAKGPGNVTAVEDRLVAEAMRLIWDKSLKPMTVADVARQLPTTRRSLERRFRDVIGHTILEEITRCRLERATRLLTHSAMSIKQVAAASGFSSTDAMARAFRHVEGVSPRDYREQQRDPASGQ
jgi:AraC-like DNA-binding protein